MSLHVPNSNGFHSASTTNGFDHSANTNGRTFLFSSESVGDGHPDKVCDQVSDAVLDAFLAKDPNSKVGCECCAINGMILVCGEADSAATIDYQKVVRDAVRRIGYDSSEKCFDATTCAVLVGIEQENSDYVEGTFGTHAADDLPASDQGLMFGYATDESPEYMPMTILWAHRLNERLRELRTSGQFDWALPDSKTQVTVEYRAEGGAVVPLRVHTVVISVSHLPKVTLETIRHELLEKVIKCVIPASFLDEHTIYHLNPAGRFLSAGPMGDAGLTGRKIIVDTYGGWGAHGGGSFSGKDPYKADRGGAYAGRWVAMSLVAAGLCRRALVQISYAIGVHEPLAVYVDSYGTVCNGRTDDDLLAIVKKNFDLRPSAIIKELDLLRPIYARTAAFGHFGRAEFPWEQPKKLVL